MGITNESKELRFVLDETPGSESMHVDFDGQEFLVDFTSDDQSTLRNFFLAIIKELRVTRVVCSLGNEETIKNEMLKKVAKDYIEMLNKEIEAVFLDIQRIELETKKADALTSD